MNGPPSRQAGFTMVELVMVLIIVGILSAVAISRFPSGIDLHPRAQQLAQDLRLAQAYAMNRGGGYRIQAPCSCSNPDPNPCTYEICDNSGRQVGPSGFLGEVAVGSFVIRFDSLGTPLDGSSTPVTVEQVIPLSHGGESQSVVVTPTTGAVRVP